jgi:pimeloyl-ACP methyl ester carboxylesterase
LYTYTSTSQILISSNNNNWIDLVLNKLINIPTYLFGGINSVVPYQSIKYQKQFYTNSYIYIFSGDNSSHFAFMENYTLFNELINKFI